MLRLVVALTLSLLACKGKDAPPPLALSVGECVVVAAEAAPDPSSIDDRRGEPGRDAGLGLGVVGRGSLGKGAALPRNDRPTTEPTIRFGRGVVAGELSEPLVRRFIRQRSRAIRACYLDRLKTEPRLRGLVTIELAITGAGQVTRASGSGVDEALAGCIASDLAQITFPEPTDGKPVQVSYPLHLTPPTHRPAPTRPAEPPPDAGSPDAAPVPEPTLVANPLEVAALQRCMAPLPRTSGVALLSVEVDAAGVARSAHVKLPDRDAAGCIAALAVAAPWPGDRPGSYQCALSWSHGR